MKSFAVSILLFVLSIGSGFGQEFEVDGINYKILSEDDKTVGVVEKIPKYEGVVVVPDSIFIDSSTFKVVSIEDQAFQVCTKLDSIFLPKTLLSIGQQAFDYCTSLLFIRIPDSVSVIGEFAFQSCSSLEQVIIPNNVTSIGASAFSFCHSLTNIDLPNQLSRLEYWLFANCVKLRTVHLPDSLSVIGEGVFTNCHSLKSISLPTSTIEIGPYAFDECENLDSIVIPNSITRIEHSTFRSCTSLQLISLPESLIDIGRSAFMGCTNLRSIYLPKSLKNIGKNAFADCLSLESIEFPNLLIWDTNNRSFRGCSSLVEYKVTDDNPNYTSIDGVLFSKDSTSLISLPGGKAALNSLNRFKSIAKFAIDSCLKLTNLTLPESLEYIGQSGIFSCPSLETITCYAINPPELFTNTLGNLISKTPSNITLFVSNPSIDLYSNTNGWNEFSIASLVLDSSVTDMTIVGYVFFDQNRNSFNDGNDYGLSSQKVLLLPDSVVAFTTTNGLFMFTVDTGNYTVSIELQDDWELTTAYDSFTIEAQQDTTWLKFGLNRPKEVLYYSPNLILNGDFEDTAVAFYSEYADQFTRYPSGTSYCFLGSDCEPPRRLSQQSDMCECYRNWSLPREYYIGNDVTSFHFDFRNPTDPYESNVMFVDGGNYAERFWCQDVYVKQSALYEFSADIAPIGIETKISNKDIITLDFTIGVDTIGSITSSDSLNKWKTQSNLWNSGINSGYIPVCLVTRQSDICVACSDFVIDNISLVQICQDSLRCQEKPYLAISGSVFLDEDGSGAMNGNEYGLSSQKVIILPDSIITYTTPDGEFAFKVDTGIYTIKVLPSPDWSLTTDSVAYTVQVENDTARWAFGVRPNNQKEALKTSLVSSDAGRCNMEVTYTISYTNEGTVTSSGYIAFIPDQTLGEIEFTETPDSSSLDGTTHYWSYVDLKINQQRRIKMRITMPDFNSMGDTLVSTVRAIGATTTASDEWQQFVRCAYDPNDKLVTPKGVYNENYVLMDDTLTYTIRFQNTGNDTAYQVVIIDQLDPAFDLNSFEVLASSHDLQTTHTRNGLVEFRFSEIMLVDSTTNEPESHGFVRFKIAVKKDLPDYTVVDNTGHIFFDFNPAVITNTVMHTFVYEIPHPIITGVNQFETVSRARLFPNPMTETALMRFENPEHATFHLRIFDLQGAVVNQQANSATQFEIHRNQLRTGVFFYSLQNQLTGEIARGKFVVQ